ncbi:MAG: acyl-[acyl-carrier-protein] thioesterase [Spirochaetota bacterium]
MNHNDDASTQASHRPRGDQAPPREHHEEILVRSYEVDPDGRLRPVVLLRMLQEAAWQHASLLGKGFHHRAEGELFWVLSRLRVRMERYPRWGERFTIRTFPVGTERLFALREFSLHTEGGELLGRASSAWLVVDASRGRPVRPQPVVADIVVTESEYDGDTERFPALDETAAAAAARPIVAPVEHGPFPVRYHDIDQYHHVNNASYLEWAIDALDASRPMGSQATELGVDFLKETLLADRYTVRVLTSDHTDRFEIVRLPAGSPDAQADHGSRAPDPGDAGNPAPEPAVRGSITWSPLPR